MGRGASAGRREAVLILIGIDEAGYGPRLGPLVVAASAFRVPEAGAGRMPDAWHDLVAAPGRAARGRFVVGDSKQVFGPSHDGARLERPLRAFLAVRAPDPAVPTDLDALLAAVGDDGTARTALPWYGGAAPTLPLFDGGTPSPDATDALRDGLAAAGIEFLGFAASVVDERRLNAAFAVRGNKADVLFDIGSGLLDRLLGLRRGSEPAGAVFDRLGGRRFYLQPLLARWPGRFTWAIDESPRSSRYRMRLESGEIDLRFDVGANADAPQVALASMLAKYLRESFMRLWNAHFAGVCPGIPPTAGYAEDGTRWLDATRAARARAGISDDDLVRMR